MDEQKVSPHVLLAKIRVFIHDQTPLRSRTHVIHYESAEENDTKKIWNEPIKKENKKNLNDCRELLLTNKMMNLIIFIICNLISFFCRKQEIKNLYT